MWKQSKSNVTRILRIRRLSSTSSSLSTSAVAAAINKTITPALQSSLQSTTSTSVGSYRRHYFRNHASVSSSSSSFHRFASTNHSEYGYDSLLLMSLVIGTIGLGSSYNSVMGLPSSTDQYRIDSVVEGKTTLCESSSPQPTDNDDNDPYENLPEVDEDTDCTMCQTFRQGPCRPLWRKLEYCFKDHEQEENGAIQCMKYFTPHQHCLAEYSNLYQLISLELKQSLVDDAERSVISSERRCWPCIKSKQNPIKMDWGKWPEFIQEMGFDYHQIMPSKNDKEIPLWQRFPENLEPVLITATASIPRITLEKKGVNKEEEMILKVAYIVDQDDAVIGLSYNPQYGDLIDQSMKRFKKDDAKETKKEEPEKQYHEFLEVDFFIIPGHTKNVKVCAMYSENPLYTDDKKEILDVVLYHSQYYSMIKAAKEMHGNNPQTTTATTTNTPSSSNSGATATVTTKTPIATSPSDPISPSHVNADSKAPPTNHIKSVPT